MLESSKLQTPNFREAPRAKPKREATGCREALLISRRRLHANKLPEEIEARKSKMRVGFPRAHLVSRLERLAFQRAACAGYNRRRFSAASERGQANATHESEGR